METNNEKLEFPIEGNVIYSKKDDVNYLAISCFNVNAETTIKAWLLERNVVFEGLIPLFIVIPYGMAAVNKTVLDLTKELAVATGIPTHAVELPPKPIGIIEDSPRSPHRTRPHRFEWKY